MSDTITTQSEVDKIAEIAKEENAANKSAVNILTDAYLKNIQQQKAELGATYEQAKAETYAASKISAQAENEALAAQGLAGKSYSTPTSGYSESSRLKADINLQNNLQQLNIEQREAVNQLSQLMMEKEAERMATFETYDAQMNATIKNAELAKLSSDISAIDNYVSSALDQGIIPSDSIINQWQANNPNLNFWEDYVKPTNSYAYNYHMSQTDTTNQKYSATSKGFISQYNKDGYTNPFTYTQDGVTYVDTASFASAVMNYNANGVAMDAKSINELLNTYGISASQFMTGVASLGADTMKNNAATLKKVCEENGLTSSASYKMLNAVSGTNYNDNEKNLITDIYSTFGESSNSNSYKESICQYILLNAYNNNLNRSNTNDMENVFNYYGITPSKFETAYNNLDSALQDAIDGIDNSVYTGSQAQQLKNILSYTSQGIAAYAKSHNIDMKFGEARNVSEVKLKYGKNYVSGKNINVTFNGKGHELEIYNKEETSEEELKNYSNVGNGIYYKNNSLYFYDGNNLWELRNPNKNKTDYDTLLKEIINDYGEDE